MGVRDTCDFCDSYTSDIYYAFLEGEPCPPPKFWLVYREEKIRLLEVLKEGDRGLWDMAKKQIGDNP